MSLDNAASVGTSMHIMHVVALHQLKVDELTRELDKLDASKCTDLKQLQESHKELEELTRKTLQGYKDCLEHMKAHIQPSTDPQLVSFAEKKRCDSVLGTV